MVSANMDHKTPRSLNLFVSFAPGDTELKDSFLQHLATLQRLGHIDCWSSDASAAGADRTAELERMIDRADLALLLLSAHALASDLVQALELPRIFDAHARRGLQVIPVILRPCAWEYHPLLGKLVPLPRNGMAVTAHDIESRDQVFTDIVHEIASLTGARGERAKPRQEAPTRSIHQNRDSGRALLYILAAALAFAVLAYLGLFVALAFMAAALLLLVLDRIRNGGLLGSAARHGTVQVARARLLRLAAFLASVTSIIIAVVLGISDHLQSIARGPLSPREVVAPSRPSSPLDDGPFRPGHEPVPALIAVTSSLGETDASAPTTTSPSLPATSTEDRPSASSSTIPGEPTPPPSLSVTPSDTASSSPSPTVSPPVIASTSAECQASGQICDIKADCCQGECVRGRCAVPLGAHPSTDQPDGGTTSVKGTRWVGGGPKF